MAQNPTNEITDKALLRKTYRIVGILLLNLLIWGIILIVFTLSVEIILLILRMIGIHVDFEYNNISLLIILVAEVSTAILTMFLLIREGTEIIRIVWKKE